MRWGFSSLSLMVWIVLLFYVAILVLFFRLIALGKNKHKAFKYMAASIVTLHALLLIGLGLNDSVASVKKVGFEVWVCGKQIQIADNSPTSRILREGGYFSDKNLNINTDSESLRIGSELKKAGLDYSDKSASLPISKDFELKVAGDTSLAWLRQALKYPTGADHAVLAINNGKVSCPTGDIGSWNVFLAKVDNLKKTYEWQKVELGNLGPTLVRAADGDGLPDCLVMDYDLVKDNPEYRCSDILKHDSKRCPEKDKSKCLYREVKSLGL